MYINRERETETQDTKSIRNQLVCDLPMPRFEMRMLSGRGCFVLKQGT